MSNVRTLTRADIMPVADYAEKRWDFRRALAALRRPRRLELGPFMTLSFESRDTIWHQIQEMLYIEKGGEEQITGELEAYAPLIPNGSELVATMMIEIDDQARRETTLRKLGHIESQLAFRFGLEIVPSRPEDDADRTREDGKTSAVHFLHFPFTPPQIVMFRDPEIEVVLASLHPEYRHMTILSPETKAILAADFAG
jgi:hypothetical protein